MNEILERGNVIKRIRDGSDLKEIAAYAREQIFQNGPKDTLVLEILSYLKLFQPAFFEEFESDIIELMGLFFKSPQPDTLQGAVFEMYHQYIKNSTEKTLHPCKPTSLKTSATNSTLAFPRLQVLGNHLYSAI